MLLPGSADMLSVRYLRATDWVLSHHIVLHVRHG